MQSLNPSDGVAKLSIQLILKAAQAAGLERLDGQLLLLHAIGRPESDRAWLLAHDDEPLETEVAQRFQALSARRLAGEPVAYILGRKEFFGLDLRVDARVLVPRPDTETLVDWSLELLRWVGAAQYPKILDLGTGSGAIALAIAHSLRVAAKPADVVAVDASPAALALASDNAIQLKLDVKFIHSNWLEGVFGRFHLIVSNPPYVASDDPHLKLLVHEPIEALTAGIDGLDDIRRIVAKAGQHLEPEGWLLLEHGYDQAQAVRSLLSTQGFVEVQSRCDLAGIERCSGGQWRP